ncbi:membrane protein YqaA with SNARE-associated domain [Nocardiopsis mwathae]|uniref:Membrane protein YqaA with SNARE-associated domain n=1 Tax=Nocardiopsis mwathae TaxID=1472723 RepID=A0A7X0D4E1_9ACTN|nr:hypothetical protein [Nocardiopsis mwathae]MBB6170990.1 membrane protein YqaA with SNARE-associated domain [Nocardiopsis mwathae]
MTSENPVQYGKVKASYFWDDGSGINGDTGLPASGEPMQKGLFASPSWPLGTEGYIVYNGKRADFFIGDRGPGNPAENCNVLLDIDGKTFAELTGESWNTNSLTVSGGNGHIDVEYYITSWGSGRGEPGAPKPMSGSTTCNSAVSPIPEHAKKDSKAEKEKKKREEEKKKAEEAKKKAEAEKKKAEEAKKKQAEEKQQAELAQNKADKVDQKSGNGEESHTGFETGTATNDLSGISLAGNELPMAAGVLTLALLPALAVAVLAKRNRPQPKHALAEAGENGSGSTWDTVRNIDWQSLKSADGWRNLVSELRRK